MTFLPFLSIIQSLQVKRKNEWTEIDRNGHIKGGNVIKQIMSEIFIQSICLLFTMEIYFVQNIHLSLKKSEVKFLARQLGLSYPTSGQGSHVEKHKSTRNEYIYLSSDTESINF